MCVTVHVCVIARTGGGLYACTSDYVQCERAIVGMRANECVHVSVNVCLNTQHGGKSHRGRSEASGPQQGKGLRQKAGYLLEGSSAFSANVHLKLLHTYELKLHLPPAPSLPLSWGGMLGTRGRNQERTKFRK